MRDTRTEQPADSTLRWGGLAGVAGGILMILTVGFVAVFIGTDLTPEQALTTFPDIKGARTVENTMYLAVLLLWVIHTLALHRALRRASPTPALFGTALSILGLVLLAAGALPHVVTAPLSDLYQAPGTTPQDQTTIVLLWHGIDTVFNALLYTGLAIIPLGLIALGKAMIDAPGYGQHLGRSTVAIGVVGLAAATAVLVGAPTMAAIGILAVTGFHLALGWKTFKAATTPHPAMLPDA